MRGKAAMLDAFAVVDEQIAGKDYMMGDFTVADTALYYCDILGQGCRGLGDLPPNVEAHYQRIADAPLGTGKSQAGRCGLSLLRFEHGTILGFGAKPHTEVTD